MIELTHKHKKLWIESGILNNIYDKNKNVIPINGKKDSIESRAKHFAKLKAIEENTNLTLKNAQTSDTYKFVIGAMMETLAEFYLKLFELSNHNLRFIEDTSEDQFERGYDYTGMAGIHGDIPIQIQIKWRDDAKHIFTKSDLWTMWNRALEENIKPKNLYLVVISSKETKGSNVLHYKEGFKEEWAPKMKIITGANMRDNIYTLQSNRDLSPFEEFWFTFKECLNK